MTYPQRRFLLNKQIAMEARRIAHAATKTCKFQPRPKVPGDDEEEQQTLAGALDGVTDADVEHTRTCNKLKREIELLALNVKLAATQPPLRREQMTEAETDA